MAEETKSTGTQGGTPEQHAAAGRQSHKKSSTTPAKSGRGSNLTAEDRRKGGEHSHSGR